MSTISYLIQVNIYVLLFYSLYIFLLRYETFFKMNRFYLVGSAVLSLAIPLFRVQWIKGLFVTEQVYQATKTLGSTVGEALVGSPVFNDQTGYSNTYTDLAQHAGSSFTASQLFWIIYSSITVILLLNFFRKLILVNRALKGDTKNQAFSFFKKVVVDEELKGKETIMDHEMVHVKQWHSADVIFFELFAALNWLNPVSYAYKKAIKNIHEFIADETAASGLADKSEYALLLVSSAFGTQPQKLTNSFYNDSLLKRRLIMLNKNKSRKTAILKYGLSVPLFAAMVIFSSATIEKSETLQKVTNKIEAAIPVVMESITNDAIKVQNNQLDKAEVLHALEFKNIERGESDNNNHMHTDLDSIFWYFAKSIKFPYSPDKTQTLGYTFVSFKLDEKGILKNPLVLQALTSSLKEQLIMIMKKARSFGPGLKGNYVLPIRFTLINGSDELLPPSTGFTKDAVELSNFKGYTIIKDLYVNGYTKNVDVKEANRMEQLMTHLKKSIKYYATDQENNINGVNYVTFEIDDNGAIKNSKVIKSISETAKEEIERVMNSAPAFGEGKSVKYILPVVFTLSTDIPTIQNTFPGIQTNDYIQLTPVVIRGYVKVPLAEINTEISPGAKTKDGQPLLNVKTTVKNNPTEGMQEHLSAFLRKERTAENGTVYVGFEVADKRPGNYRIIKSDKPNWEKDLIKHFESYTDTVGLAPGKYYFYKKIGEGTESRERKMVVLEGFHPSFGSAIITSVSCFSIEETVHGVKRIVNYISAPYLKNPVILVDGKIAEYKTTKKGFRMEQTDYPKNAKVKVYQGEKAVANYNETVRKKGLIVVTTE